VEGDVRGADVVVLGAETDLERIRDSAPASTVLVTVEPVAGWCQKTYEATLFPRPRIIGLPDAAQAAAASRSIVFELDEEFDVLALAGGEFVPRRAKLGLRGMTALL
jgi:hypothetical protein